jgi:hypothetical protein
VLGQAQRGQVIARVTPIAELKIVVLILVALLGTEWILRRKHDLP